MEKFNRREAQEAGRLSLAGPWQLKIGRAGKKAPLF
jgi:hypothetical protein